MSFFLSENIEKRHLFTFDTFFPISGEPSKNRKSNPKSNPKLIKVVTLNSNRNSNPKHKITIRTGIKKGSHKLPNQHSKK
nr:MAG TPA: hypothetical protein [Caudoviricetes sp.]